MTPERVREIAEWVTGPMVPWVPLASPTPRDAVALARQVIALREIAEEYRRLCDRAELGESYSLNPIVEGLRARLDALDGAP
jgi:hypothetical protein